MNQILNFIENTEAKSFMRSSKFHTKRFLFYMILIFSILLIIGCIFYFIRGIYTENRNQAISKQMLDNFNITTLYSTSSEYQTNYESPSSSPFVVGMIEIPTIDVHYPILSEITEENLKIAPCQFYGPNLNEAGNVCIAAHNYRNYKFFSRLNNLNLNDIIDIYDSIGSKTTYYVYDKYITDSSYLECINQNTNQQKEITLVTCNKPDNSKRIIVKAKEKK